VQEIFAIGLEKLKPASASMMSMQRLGVIIPSSNTTIEIEFSTILHGTDVSFHIARIHLSDVTVKDLEDMQKETQAAARLLKDADVNLVAFACTSGSLVKGLGYDGIIAKKISKAAGCPAVTTSGAVVEALKTLKAHKIALATPYIAEVTDREIDFLQKSGFEIVNTRSLNIKENLKIGKLTPNDAATIAKNADSNLADAIFISCTNFPTFQAIPTLEKQLKKPVISSNSATLWASLRALNAKITINLGKLFET
jgi:maleate isomerase